MGENQMANASQMQGTPWHAEFLKSDGNRRHPAKCKYHNGKGKNRICMNSNCPKYHMNCNTAKCDHYDENTSDNSEENK